MDRASIEDLFAFTGFSWRRYEELIRPLGDEMLTKPAPGSGWPALGDALSHMTWAHVRWLASPDGTTAEPEPSWRTWTELDDYRRHVLDHDRRYLDSLSDEELLAPREMDVDGVILVYSPADIFAHTIASTGSARTTCPTEPWPRRISRPSPGCGEPPRGLRNSESARGVAFRAASAQDSATQLPAFCSHGRL